MRLKVILLGVLVFWACGVEAKPNCPSLLKKLGGIVLDKSLLIGIAAGGLVAGSELVGIQQETPHLGMSIYFDYENILSHFSPIEQRLIQNAKDEPEKVVSLLVSRLALKSGDSFDIYPYLKPLMASQYFSDNPPPTNVCRHKALILNALLNQIGIRSRLVTGTIQADSGRGSHVWVVLPDLKKVADPMNGVFVKQEKYDETFKAKESLGVIRFPKIVGLMAR